MNAKITYALILSMALIVFRLLLFFLEGKISTIAVSLVAMLLSWPIIFFILWLGLRAVRDERPDQCITFGQAFLAGFIISVIAAIVMGLYTLLHCVLIDPNYIEKSLEKGRELWEAQGMSEQQMEAGERFTRILMNPVLMAVYSMLKGIFEGAICSLIAAAIVKRNPQPAAQVPPPL